MPEDDEKSRRDPVVVVGPYARIRIIAAVIVVLLALATLAYRSLSG